MVAIHPIWIKLFVYLFQMIIKIIHFAENILEIQIMSNNFGQNYQQITGHLSHSKEMEGILYQIILMMTIQFLLKIYIGRIIICSKKTFYQELIFIILRWINVHMMLRTKTLYMIQIWLEIKRIVLIHDLLILIQQWGCHLFIKIVLLERQHI